MEEAKYYEIGNDNTYCVRFANRQGLSNERITEIFSEWGNVHAVTKAGDDYGFRFVRYRHEEEVNRCIEALRDHGTIKLLKPRSKSTPGQQNGQRRLTNNNNYQDSTNPRGSRNAKNNDAVWTGSREGENLPSNGNSRFAIRTSSPGKVQDDLNLENENEDRIKEKSMNFGKIEDDLCIKGEKTNLHGGYFETQVWKKPPPGNDGIFGMDVPELSRTGISPRFRRPSVILRRPNDTADIPVPMPIKMDQTFHPSLAGDSFDNAEAATKREKEEILTAEQLVVANVPTDFSENLILHLLRKHKPICISPMKLTAYQAIPYCVVYFMSAQQAVAAESELDRRKFGGQSLIVLRL